jgi:hypothetical protein
LRKKKSFSRVSNWLFPSSNPSSEHARNMSLDSITNSPKPVTSREGFYQCIDLQPPARTSIDTASTVSTLESELEAPPTIETTWTPESSPGRERAEKEVEIRALSIDSGREESVELTRVRTFGEKKENEERWRMEALPTVAGHMHGRNSVGVAF